MQEENKENKQCVHMISHSEVDKQHNPWVLNKIFWAFMFFRGKIVGERGIREREERVDMSTSEIKRELYGKKPRLTVKRHLSCWTAH